MLPFGIKEIRIYSQLLVFLTKNALLLLQSREPVSPPLHAPIMDASIMIGHDRMHGRHGRGHDRPVAMTGHG